MLASPVLAEWEAEPGRFLEARWPANLAFLMRFQAMEDPVSNKS